MVPLCGRNPGKLSYFEAFVRPLLLPPTCPFNASTSVTPAGRRTLMLSFSPHIHSHKKPTPPTDQVNLTAPALANLVEDEIAAPP